MATELNGAGERHARELIDGGHVDRNSDWSFDAEDGNRLLGDPPDWAEYSHWFLGRDTNEDKETKAAWKYPFGKSGKVYRSALTAIRQRAGQQHDDDIVAAAGKLLNRIDAAKSADAPIAERGTIRDPRFEVRAAVVAAPPGAPNEAYIFGDIGENIFAEESTSAIAFVRAIAGLDNARPLDIHINSYGGSVADGLAIYTTIRNYAGATRTLVDGVAVSIASLIALAADTVEMAETSMLMIHAPWNISIGNAREHRRSADVLDKHAAVMHGVYARRAGEAVAGALLADGLDHWFTAQEALDAGFADAIGAPLAIAASLLKHSRFHPPAARASTTQRRTQAMEPQNLAPGATTDPATDISATTNVVAIETARNEGAQAARNAEHTRRTAIRTAFAAYREREGVAAIEADALADGECTVEAAQANLLAALGAGTVPLGRDARVEAGESAIEKLRAGAQASLLARTGIEPSAADAQNNFRGHTLFELARAHAEAHGVRTGHLSRMGVVGAAFTLTSGDFPELLANVAHKSLLKGWGESPETFPLFTNPGTLTDFKPTKRVGLGIFDALPEVLEGAEYEYGTVGDRGETIQLAKYGKLLSFTREAIINDDLSALNRSPLLMGRAAKRTIGNLVVAILTGNPTMADGKALFHADHDNLPTAAALGSDSVDALIVAMAKQKDADSKATALNIPLAHLIVPVALQGTALQVMNAEFQVDASAKNSTQPNKVRGRFDVIADARLDSDSTQTYYGAADANAFDVIEVAYLDGQQDPYMELKNGFEVDGVAYKVRIEAGVKALDFRGLAKNAGA